MIVEVQGIHQGWNPSVVQAGLSNLKPDIFRFGEDFRTALYRSWFADDSGMGRDVRFPSVRKVAWIAPGDMPNSGGGGRTERQTVGDW